MTRTSRIVTYAALTALGIATGFVGGAEKAHARSHFDYWNGSGASVNHQYFKGLTPFDNSGYNSGDVLGTFGQQGHERDPGVPTQAEVDKAHRDQHTCGFVVLYDDTGAHRSRPDGCN